MEKGKKRVSIVLPRSPNRWPSLLGRRFNFLAMSQNEKMTSARFGRHGILGIVQPSTEVIIIRLSHLLCFLHHIIGFVKRNSRDCSQFGNTPLSILKTENIHTPSIVDWSTKSHETFQIMSNWKKKSFIRFSLARQCTVGRIIQWQKFLIYSCWMVYA